MNVGQKVKMPVLGRRIGRIAYLLNQQKLAELV